MPGARGSGAGGGAGRDRFEPRPPVGEPVIVIDPPGVNQRMPRGGGADAAGWRVTPVLARLLVVNALVAYLALAVVLPSPWGALVPLGVLAQMAMIRHGAAGTAAAAGLGFAGGGVVAMLGVSHGQAVEPLRLAIGGALLCVMVIAGWPSRPRAARGARG